MAEGCHEQIDLEFARWLWEFPQKVRPQIIEILAKYSEKNIKILRNEKEVKEFLKQDI